MKSLLLWMKLVYCSNIKICNFWSQIKQIWVIRVISISHQAWDVESMLVKCWVSVSDSGRITNQHCVNALFWCVSIWNSGSRGRTRSDPPPRLLSPHISYTVFTPWIILCWSKDTLVGHKAREFTVNKSPKFVRRWVNVSDERAILDQFDVNRLASETFVLPEGTCWAV